MSVVTLDAGTRLILKDESEILIPKKLREQVLDILYYTHSAEEAIMIQCKMKIFWPGMKKDLKQKYRQCNQSQENKTLQAQAHNEVSSEDIFKNCLPGQRIEADYAKKGNQSYFMIVDILTDVMQAYKTHGDYLTR